MEKNQLTKNVPNEKFLDIIKGSIVDTWYKLLSHEVYRYEMNEGEGEQVGFGLELEDKTNGKAVKAGVTFVQDEAHAQTTYGPAGMEKPMFTGLERRYKEFLAEKFGESNK